MKASLVSLGVSFGVILSITAGIATEKALPYDVEPSGVYSKAFVDRLAEKIGITNEILVLQNPSSNELLQLRAQNFVNKRILSVSLDCSAVSAELLAEESDVRDRRLRLEASRSVRVITTNSLNFLSRGAVNAPAVAYSIPASNLPTIGNILGSVANGTSTGLSVVALAEGRSGKSKSNGGASLLAPIFFDDADHSKFAYYVWDYLNCAPLDADPNSSSHRERLKEEWIKAGLAPNPDKPSGREKLRKMLEVDAARLTIADLQKRETMLHGLRTTIVQMTKGLEQITQNI